MWKVRVLAALVAIAMAAVGMVATSGSAVAAPFDSTVVVHGDAHGLTVQHGSVHAGLVRFAVDTTNDQGSDVTMFAPAPEKNVNDVLADLQDELSQDPQKSAKGTRELVTDARFYGLATVVKGTPVIVTERLTAGTYYLFDTNPVFAGGTPDLTTLEVSGPGAGHGDVFFPFPLDAPLLPGHLPFLPGHRPFVPGPLPFLSGHLPFVPGLLPVFPGHATVKLTSDDRFESPDVLPKTGTITVRNISDTIHFMGVSPVKPGTTEAQIQQFFESDPQGPPSFATGGPSIEMGVLSPGRSADITYQLPAGTYDLECFIPDDESGMPHAFMGMHKVVTLK
jgi:uncharacterized cupredoxin-like copper-binding protein